MQIPAACGCKSFSTHFRYGPVVLEFECHEDFASAWNDSSMCSCKSELDRVYVPGM